MGEKIVVDSSVFIKWIKTRDEEFVGEARRLLAEVEARSLDVHVPALLLYEVGNILVLKTRLSATALGAAVEQLELLPFKIAPPTTPLLKRAASVSRKYRMTFYDASFVALAIELDCPFVTADRRLVALATGVSQIRHLSHFGVA